MAIGLLSKNSVVSNSFAEDTFFFLHWKTRLPSRSAALSVLISPEYLSFFLPWTSIVSIYVVTSILHRERWLLKRLSVADAYLGLFNALPLDYAEVVPSASLKPRNLHVSLIPTTLAMTNRQ